MRANFIRNNETVFSVGIERYHFFGQSNNEVVLVLSQLEVPPFDRQPYRLEIVGPDNAVLDTHDVAVYRFTQKSIYKEIGPDNEELVNINIEIHLFV